MSGAPPTLTLITIHLAGETLEILLPRSEGESVDLVSEEEIEDGPAWTRAGLGGIALRYRVTQKGGGR